MQSHIPHINIHQLEAELREEKSKFAKAFHRGKSMGELRDVVDKIHSLEQKVRNLLQQSFNRQ